MDEATPQDQILLGSYPQCGKDPDVLCHHCLLPGRPGWLQIESWAPNLRNLTDTEYLSTGQTAC